MASSDTQDNQDGRTAKPRVGDLLAEENPIDAMRLSESTSEPPQCDSLMNGGVAADKTPGRAAETAVASHQLDECSSAAVDDGKPPAVAGEPLASPSQPTAEPRVADSYRQEVLVRSIQSLIAQSMKSGRKDDADTASRLLVDLTEHRISTNEAQEILDLLSSQHRSNEARRFLDGKHPIQRIGMLVIVIVMLMPPLFICAVMVGLHNAPKHTRHSIRDANYSGYQYLYLPVSKENVLHSMSGTAPTTFTITNRLNKSVSVYWLNYRGERVLYGDLAPGQSLGEQTYLTHPWVVVDDDTGKSIMLFLPGTKQNEQINVDKSSAI